MTGNLKKLPLDADQRACAIRGAILPVALHGCEILCPSPDRMASLRTVICETLVGQMPNAHRWMATSCLSTHNLDPLFNVAKRLLSLVRRGVTSWAIGHVGKGCPTHGLEAGAWTLCSF